MNNQRPQRSNNERHDRKPMKYFSNSREFKKECSVKVYNIPNRTFKAGAVIEAAEKLCGENAILAVVPNEQESSYEITTDSEENAMKLTKGIPLDGFVFDCTFQFVDIIVVSFLHLPAHIPDADIIEKLTSKGCTIESPVYRHVHPGTQVADGTRYVRVKFPPGLASLSWSMKFDTGNGEKYFKVVHNNQRSLCNYCESPFHKYRECPKLKCRGCGKQGHKVYECKEEKCGNCHKLPLFCLCQGYDDGTCGYCRKEPCECECEKCGLSFNECTCYCANCGRLYEVCSCDNWGDGVYAGENQDDGANGDDDATQEGEDDDDMEDGEEDDGENDRAGEEDIVEIQVDDKDRAGEKDRAGGKASVDGKDRDGDKDRADGKDRADNKDHDECNGDVGESTTNNDTLCFFYNDDEVKINHKKIVVTSVDIHADIDGNKVEQVMPDGGGLHGQKETLDLDSSGDNRGSQIADINVITDFVSDAKSNKTDTKKSVMLNDDQEKVVTGDCSGSEVSEQGQSQKHQVVGTKRRNRLKFTPNVNGNSGRARSRSPYEKNKSNGGS